MIDNITISILHAIQKNATFCIALQTRIQKVRLQTMRHAALYSFIFL